eukprot:m.142134 g.142134  ORF g.142134 m.142134 type:complete len:327 (+) comp14049_c0_seq14:165-1145(+)
MAEVSFTRDEQTHGGFGVDADAIDMTALKALEGNCDAWEDIQHRTFVKWVNSKLAIREMSIDNLPLGLKDGIALINLLEILSEKKVGRYFKKAFSRIHWLNNLDVAFKFMAKEGIQLVNIGCGDLADEQLKAGMGIIWTLLAKYSTTMNKLDLTRWVRSMVGPETEYNMSVTNLQTDLQNGTFACALVDSCHPGTIDMENLPSAALDRAQLALDKGEELGVAPLLEAKDMINPNIDEFSVMTYISQLNELRPNGAPPPQRASGYTKGLYVELLSGPPSQVEVMQGEGVAREITAIPDKIGNGFYEVEIRWMGQLITTHPIIIKNKA